MISTLEKLRKNDEIWISVGRKRRGSALSVSLGQPAVLNIKMVAEDQLQEESMFQ